MTVGSRTTIATRRLELLSLDADDLGAWVAGDAGALSERTGAAFPSPLKTPPLFEDDLPGIHEMLSRDSGRDTNSVWLIMERESGRPVGIAGINTGRASGTAVTGYSVYPDQQGKGFATEAMQELATWLFTNTDVAILQATIPPSNTASIRVAEKLGMQATARAQDPEVGEVVVYELRKEERSAPPRA